MESNTIEVKTNCGISALVTPDGNGFTTEFSDRSGSLVVDIWEGRIRVLWYPEVDDDESDEIAWIYNVNQQEFVSE